MGGKEPIEAKVQDLTTFCTTLTRPVQRNDRFTRSSCAADDRAWVGSHSS